MTTTRVVDWGELPGLPGLVQRRRAGRRAGLADQDLQIVIQIQATGVLGDQSLVPGDELPVSEHQQLARVQQLHALKTVVGGMAY
ncbi:hypothetical protein [Nonomuraea sp. SYSU D8015]|uniref:hypothetical protein n=1 Tax=Nonomuraea sp. SYSU D8015 TaxID=2593644 RepID=UPI001CB72C61|nr:hypothetical protein [Nonomuraea sp. SYSU D8015]